MNIIYYFDPKQDESTVADLLVQSIALNPSDNLVRLDITSDSAIQRAYDGTTPLIEVGPYHIRYPFTKPELEVAINAARNRLEQLQDGSVEAMRIKKGSVLTRGDKIAHWFSQYYIWVFNGFVFIYLLLPFLAPIMAKVGSINTATAIHKVYSPLCHQLAFRSWFLFGEQAFYPRELAGIDGIITYEEITGSSYIDLDRARQFIGNDELGYKIALCQRDIAIYGSILLFGVIFGLTGRKIKPLRWYWWVLLGMAPIGLDGVSQLPSLMMNVIPTWLFERESTPILRTITGVLFGMSTMWYMYPLIEETMQETRSIIATKMAVIKQKNAKM